MILIVACLLLFSAVNGYTYTDMEKLKAHLFNNYDATIRPVLNQTKQMQINVSITLRSIVDLDLTSGYLDTTGYILMVWTDENMRWNETEHADIQTVCLDDEPWSPTIAPVNSVNSGPGSRSTLLLSDGTVIQFAFGRLSTFCELDMRLYPKDGHTCKFEFLSIKYSCQDLQLVPMASEVDISLLTAHGEWRIIGSSVSQSSAGNSLVSVYGSEVIFTVVLERQPDFTVIHKIVPLFILACAALFTHVIPLNSGERISYAVTVLLAFVFWQSLVSEELPKNSSKLSLFSIGITCCMSGAGLITIISVILCRVASFREERPIPAILQLFIRKRFGKTKIENDSKIPPQVSGAANQNLNQPYEGFGSGKVSRCADNNESNALDDAVEVDITPITWTEIAHFFDLFLLKFHIVFAAIVRIVCSLIFII